MGRAEDADEEEEAFVLTPSEPQEAEAAEAAEVVTPSAEVDEAERERVIYEACGDDYGYLCLVLQAVAEPT